MKTDQLYSLYRESTGITTDSRSISDGQIFFALWGENFNGNKFAADALAKGASWAVIDDPQFETERTILVDDCLAELQALAAHHRKVLGIPVLAITGTNGKTTTKELIASVLSRKFKVHYTRGNLNNHIGVPLTILSAPSDTGMMIIEMGANHEGEIRALCRIANPGFGMITNIGKAHIEGFGSFEGVIRAKTEMYEYLKKTGGVAFYNDLDPLLTEKIFNYVVKAVPYSDPDGQPLEIGTEQDPSGLGLALRVDYNHKSWKIRSTLFGAYNYWNIKAAVAVGIFFEVGMDKIASAIEQYIPANNRSQVRNTVSNTIICDSYNANPSSMLLALQSFSSLGASPKIVILGDMLELGEKTVEEHVNVVAKLSDVRPDKVFLVGNAFGRAARGTSYLTFADTAGLADYLRANPVKGYTILVKGSRGTGLEKIYDLL